MKLPIPFLLYVTALGLFGFAGWTLYTMLPLLREETRQAATSRGQQQADVALSRGKGQSPASADWQYGASWWGEFKEVNLTGKLPPKPEVVAEKPKEPEAPPMDLRPLDQIVELVSLVYDGKEQGRGGNTHVIVRYKPEANVQPPEWYVRENLTATSSSTPAAMPRDAVPTRANVRPNMPATTPQRPAMPRPSTPMPSTMVGREILQKVWVHDDGDPRRSPELWPPFQNIRLVGVSSDAQVAYFVRTLPPAKEGQPAPTPEEEPLIKTALGLDQDLLRTLRSMDGREPTATATAAPAAPAGRWMDVEETTLVGNVRHIGRADERRFRDEDDFFANVNVDTYVSDTGKTRGLIVKNVDRQLAQRFGINDGDVLIEVNGRPVQTRAQAIAFGKAEYKKGVRSFVTKWLSNGAIVERIYQAPDR